MFEYALMRVLGLRSEKTMLTHRFLHQHLTYSDSISMGQMGCLSGFTLINAYSRGGSCITIPVETALNVTLGGYQNPWLAYVLTGLPEALSVTPQSKQSLSNKYAKLSDLINRGLRT